MGESAYSFAWILAPSPPNNLFIWFIKVILCIYWIFLIFFDRFSFQLNTHFCKTNCDLFPLSKVKHAFDVFVYTI